MTQMIDHDSMNRSFAATPDADLLGRNLAALARVNPDLPERVLAADDKSLELEMAGDGLPSGTWEGRRLASRHRPGEEVTRQLGDLDLREVKTVAFLGFGLGLHVEHVARGLKHHGLVIVHEPDLALLKAVLSRIDITDWVAGANVLIVTDCDDPTALHSVLVGREPMVMLGMKIIEHAPSLIRLGESSARFTRILADFANTARMTVMTTLGRSAETMGNLLANLDHYVFGRSIAELKGSAAGRLGVVVSAGPSLRRNLHLLAGPGVRERCAIIATQTTLRPLLEAGVAPHYVTALDYHAISSRFYEGIREEDVVDTELVVDPRVNPAVPDAWPGRLRVIDSEDVDEFLGPLARNGVQLEACATVAHLAYVLARFLGCDPVALIGQDLGFTDGLYYAPGNAIHEVWRPELGMFNTIETMEWERIVRHRGQLSERVDVHDRTIYTDNQMLTYLQQFEGRFRADEQLGLITIDATEGGVKKAHAITRPLAEVLDEHGVEGDPIEFPRADSPDRSKVARVIDQLNGTLRDVQEIQGASMQARGIIEEMIDADGDQVRMSPMFERLGKQQARVARNGHAFKLVDRLNQLGVFRRLRADHHLDLSEGMDELEKQKAQLQRDLVNVEWTAEAADEMKAMIQDSIRLVRDGIPVEERRRAADLEREIGLADLPVAEVRVAAVVAVDPAMNGIGMERTLDGRMLQGTLQQLDQSQELAGIILLLPDSFDLDAMIDRSGINLPLHVHRCGASVFGPEIEAIRAARAFADSSWRGGIHGFCAADEVFAPAPTAQAMVDGDFHAALLVGPDWSLLPVAGEAGIDRVVRRYREQPRLECVFNQAPPGMGGMVVSRALTEEFAGNRVRHATLGHLLGYRSERPESDLIVQDNNVPVPPAIRSASHRCIPDRPDQAGVFDPFLVEGDSADPQQVISTLEHRLGEGEIDPTPRHLMVEICGDGSRGMMDVEVFGGLLAGLQGNASCTLTLHGEGDPLLHPRFDELISMAKESGIKAVHVRTALQVDAESIDRLLACEPTVISIDLDADSEETHEKIHGSGQWLKVITNLERLANGRRIIQGEGAAAFALPWIVPRLRRCVDTLGDQASFFERWRRQLGTAVVEGGLEHCDQGDDDLSRTWPPEKHVAEQSMRIMMVMADGTVPVAGVGSEVIGTVGEVDTSELWRALVQARRILRGKRGVDPGDLSMIRWSGDAR